MSETKSICPICGSKRVIHARHDSDWGGGNSCNLANPDDCYTEDDLRDEKNEQIYGDIDIYVCKECNCIWDRYDHKAISALTARVAELTEALTKIQVMCNFASFDMLTVGLVCKIRDAYKEVLK